MKKLTKAIKAVLLVAAYVGINFVVTLLVQITYMLWNESSGAISMAEVTQNVLNNSYFLSVIATIITFWIYLIIGKLRGFSPEEIIENKKKPSIIYAMAACLAIGMRLLVTVYYSYSQYVDVLKKSIENSGKVVPEITDTTQVIIALFAIIIVAPMFEEFLFRGIMIGELTKTVRPWLAILIQAAFFGLAHGVLFQSLFAFVIGIVLGWAYYRTQSLKMAIICHSVFNLSAILAQENLTLRSGTIVAVMGLVLVVFSLTYIFKYCKRQ